MLLQLQPAITTPPLAREPARTALAFTLAPATAAHIPAITTIYRSQIEGGLGSYEDPLPDAAEMARRLTDLQSQGLPALVALDARRHVVGFTWATPFRTKAHYRYTVEDSIHVHPDARRSGIATALLKRLVQDCTRRGYRQMIAVIGDSRNRASLALHERQGFQPCGYFRSVGHRPGEWCDAVMLQRALGTVMPEAS